MPVGGAQVEQLIFKPSPFHDCVGKFEPLHMWIVLFLQKCYMRQMMSIVVASIIALNDPDSIWACPDDIMDKDSPRFIIHGSPRGSK